VTPGQWIYYFAAELVNLLPAMSFATAVAFGRASRGGGQPEKAAHDVAALLSNLSQRPTVVPMGSCESRRQRPGPLSRRAMVCSCSEQLRRRILS
jgi:hypothetical protein